MNYPNGVTGDGQSKLTQKEQAEIRRKLYGEGVSIEEKKLQEIIDLKESERKNWADLAIKKQALIEKLGTNFHSITENAILGNMAEMNRIAHESMELIWPNTNKPTRP